MKWKDDSNDFGTVAQSCEIDNGALTVAQGVAQNQRIGRKIAISSFFIRWRLNLPDTTDATALTDSVRLMVVMDRQANGAAFAGTDILTTDNYISFNNLFNQHRFKMLMDKRIDLNYSAGGYDGTQEVLANSGWTEERYIKFPIPVVITYDDINGTQDERTINNISVVCVSANGLATAKAYTRIRYTDL